MRALEMAKYITNSAISLGKPISHMHLNVILYNLQELFKNEYSQRLIDDDFVAGRTCPVIPEVVGYYMRTFNYRKITEKEAQNIDICSQFRAEELRFISDTIKKLIDIPFLDQLEEIKNEAHSYRRALTKGENSVIPFEKIGILTIRYKPEINDKKSIKLKVKSDILGNIKEKIRGLLERSHVLMGEKGSIELVPDDKYQRFYLLIAEDIDLTELKTIRVNNLEVIIKVRADENQSVKLVEVNHIVKTIQESYTIFNNYINPF